MCLLCASQNCMEEPKTDVSKQCSSNLNGTSKEDPVVRIFLHLQLYSTSEWQFKLGCFQVQVKHESKQYNLLWCERKTIQREGRSRRKMSREKKIPFSDCVKMCVQEFAWRQKDRVVNIINWGILITEGNLIILTLTISWSIVGGSLKGQCVLSLHFCNSYPSAYFFNVCLLPPCGFVNNTEKWRRVTTCCLCTINLSGLYMPTHLQ